MLDKPAGTDAFPVPLQDRPRYFDPSPVTSGSLGLAAAIAVLRRRRLPFLLCALMVPLCAFVALHRVTPLYTATGSLIYDPSEYKMRELQSILQADPVTEPVMASQAEILHSLRIAQRVAERGNLFANPEFNASLCPPGLLHRALATFEFLLGMDPDPDPAPDPGPGPVVDDVRNATLLAVQAALHANAVRFSRVIEVTFTARDPVIAAAAVNNAMDAYIKGQFAAKQRANDRAKDFLERRAAELRSELRSAEDKIAAYRAQRGLLQGMHAGIDAEQMTHLSEDLVHARGELANAEARLDAARGRAGAAAQAAIAPSVVQLRAQQDALTAQLQGLQARVGLRHPEAESLHRQLEEAQRTVGAETQRVLAAIEADVRAARERVITLEGNLHTSEQAAEQNAQAQIPLNAMVRDAEALRTQLQAVLERLQQTAQLSAIETADAHEISQALPPSSPSWPRTGPMLAGSIVAGIALGLLLVQALQLADPTLNSGAELRAATGLPCFALLPQVAARALAGQRVEDYVVRRPLSLFAEQVRALRAGLWLGAHHPRVIAITAVRAGEGKSSIALSLGRSACMSGERVVIVECDLRSPRIQQRLQGEAGPGLAEVLRGEAELNGALRKDLLTGMAYLPAGKPGGDALGLFMSDCMGRTLQTLREDYDLVLLDAPPVQATTEARVVASVADATVLCVRWRSTPKAALGYAMEMLEETQANLAGTVLTRLDPRVHVRSGQADAEVYHRRSKRFGRG
jgi:capsular exopolysaccharide synthesis family protein